MKENIIKSLVKSGYNHVDYDTYLTSTETNMFAFSDNKELLYISIDGHNYVISLTNDKNIDFLLVELNLNHIDDLKDIAKAYMIMLTNNGMFTKLSEKIREIERLYNVHLNKDSYLCFIVQK